ncbi:MAG TPA: HNH endonuclease [Candidatus Binatia bacterium]
MSTYLIKWNPKKSPWADLAQNVEDVRRKGFFDSRWSCGNTKRIRQGDRVFLLRTGVAPRGIVATGIVNEETFEDTHWDQESSQDTALFIGVRFDTLLHPERDGILTIDQLQTEHLVGFPWHTQGSGITIPPLAAEELETAWSGFLTAHGQQPISLADEVTAPLRFFEGATRQVSVNSYERNPYARHQCIEHYGCRCCACGFDFEKAYGQLGQGFIHVHHLKPLSEIREQYEIDPITDLRPICPNCHTMIHRGSEMLTIEELRPLIQAHG